MTAEAARTAAVPKAADSIAPEASAAIRAAQDSLEQEARKAALVGDPTAGPLSSMSLMLGSMHKLFVDGSLTLARQIETAGQHIEAAKQPVRDDELRRAVIAGIGSHAHAAIRVANWRIITIATTAVIAFGLVCVGGTWLVARSHLMAAVAGIEHRMTGPEAERWLTIMQNNDIVAAEKAGTCAPQNGHTACTIAVWVEPLPPPTLAPEKR